MATSNRTAVMSESQTPEATRGRRPRASIQTILLLMLLAVSVIANVVVGTLGYLNGGDALRSAAIDRVVEVRDSRAREITRLFETIENSLLVHSRGASVIGASAEFNAAFADLADAELTPEQDAALESYFTDVFRTDLEAVVGRPVDVAPFVPTGAAQRYLALNYTAPHDDFDAALAVDDAGDGSAWSAAHASYHDYFRRMTQLLDYQDTLLIDTAGNVVYSAYKGVDLGTNLRTGPYAVSNLGEAFEAAMAGQLLDSVIFTDFETYRPALDQPAAWAVSLVAQDGVTIGALAVEMPIDRIEEVMTGDRGWADSGLGETGETYLVGPDEFMRSPSRDLIEDPDRYAAEARAAGLPEVVVDQAVASGETLLLQPVRTEAAREALLGKRGTVVARGYLGDETIAAYAPLEVANLGWVIIAEVETSEAFGAVASFTTNLVISSAIIVLVVSLLSLVLAQFLVRPLRRLQVAAERIAAGETGVQVDAGSTNELSRLATAFNDMSRSLQIKADLIDEQQKENERLLLSLMPEAVARKYRDGERTIAQDHQEVCVLFADIVGFDDYARTLDSEHALDVLNELVKQFDEAAERIGIERVRTTRQGYLASCGMSVPRVDAVRRVVEFALELQDILRRFSGQNGADLNLRAGLDVGSATSGLVGRQSVVYDLWGDAVSLAFRLQGGAASPGIYATQAVVDRVGDSAAISEAGVVDTGTGAQRVWRIERADR
jgi:class 3 adenylate cyclase